MGRGRGWPMEVAGHDLREELCVALLDVRAVLQIGVHRSMVAAWSRWARDSPASQQRQHAVVDVRVREDDRIQPAAASCCGVNARCELMSAAC